MRNFLRHSASVALALGALLAPSLSRADDSVLFSTTGVAPNVLLLMDNSASMNHIVHHPAFNPAQAVTCNSATYGSFPSNASGAFNPNADYYVVGNTFYWRNSFGNIVSQNGMPRTHCGKTHTLPSDNNATPDPVDGKRYTRYTGAYLNWLFSTQSDASWPEISSTNNGFPSSCVGGSSFGKYQRTRMNVAKQILKDVVCQVNLVGQVRFGIATFRANGTADPNGGYVVEPVDIPNSNQQADLVAAIQSLDADSWTPLGEALFQIYTYFMSRSNANLPVGVDGSTKFPVYTYKTSSAGVGGEYTSNGPPSVPVDPIQYSCQKNFVIVVTDGDPTMDDFNDQSPLDTAYGFDDFMDLIGDYNPDGENETNANLICSGCKSSFYLDDIAKYMHEQDFRPDFNGDQTLDVYTIGFSSGSTANALLQKTANAANGLFFATSDQDLLAQAIIDSLQDIIEKSQSFTAATVPASRTAAGEQIYVSLFTPSNKSPYWNGVLRSYRLTGDGRILDKNGQCALDDPTANCNTGNFLPTATHPPYWDAATAMPLPSSRTLRVSKLSLLGVPSMFAFRHPQDGGLIDAAALGVTYPPAVPYSGSVATDAESLAAEIIANVRGCYFGTGANSVACQTRPAVLSDIFHSNPVVVAQPGFGTGEASFVAFKATQAARDRVIYAGSNGGFLHGFDAGTWQPLASPPSYTAGSGVERFGFMPWPGRQNVRHLPQDTGGRDYYFVDGSPQAADVWIHSTATQTVKLPAGTEWRTVVMGGLRQGGPAYYALDVTDPDATVCPVGTVGTGYPCYMWEFPAENGPAAIKATIGETWGDAIAARIKVSVSGVTVERWVAIVSGGYHPSGDPNNHSSYTAAATQGRSIWIVDLKTGEPIAKRQFDTTGDCTTALASQALDEKGMCFAIAATPAVYDVDGDGFDDLIVAGDLGGNLWKWVIGAVGYDPVNDATKTTADNNAVWPFRKFFRAPAYGTNPYYYKSFFFPPTATKKNNTVWFGFGSGERNDLLYMSDPATTADNNRFYVIKDLDPLDAGSPLQPLTQESDLLDLTNSSVYVDSPSYKGYFIIGNEGEKWVTNVEILSDYVFAGSYIPLPSLDPCELSGVSFLYRFRIDSGEPLNDGTPPSSVDPRAIDLGAGFPTDPRISVGPSGDADVIVSKQGGSIISGGAGKVGGGTGYWMELNN